MASGTEEEIHAAILENSGIDTRSVEIRTVTDQVAALKSDLVRIEQFPLLPKGIELIGAIYNVKTGELFKKTL
jgi:carbonic anhydrase